MSNSREYLAIYPKWAERKVTLQLNEDESLILPNGIYEDSLIIVPPLPCLVYHPSDSNLRYQPMVTVNNKYTGQLISQTSDKIALQQDKMIIEVYQPQEVFIPQTDEAKNLNLILYCKPNQTETYQLTYLMKDIGWTSHYVGLYDRSQRRLNLHLYATIINQTAETFNPDQLSLISVKSSAADCGQVEHQRQVEHKIEYQLTPMSIFSGKYQLLLDGQIELKGEVYYQTHLPSQNTTTLLRLTSTKDLPAGNLTLYDQVKNSYQGQSTLPDTRVGDELNIPVGRNQVTIISDKITDHIDGKVRDTYYLSVTNPFTESVNISLLVPTPASRVEANPTYVRQRNGHLEWMFTSEAGRKKATIVVTYSVTK